MATTILIKRGLDANRTSITPLSGELIATTDKNTLFLGNGLTLGGVPITASNSETASYYAVSNPTGQAYYGATETSSVAGIVATDRTEDAFNKVELILEKLAPAKAPLLSSRTLSILANSYTALSASVGTSTTNVYTGATPVFTASGAFGDGDGGSLTASIDGVDVGTRAIAASPTSNVGTYGMLQITNNADYWAGTAGKEGFWRQLHGQINATGQTAMGPHTAFLKHSTTGQTPNLTYYIDDAVTPTSVAGTTSGSGFSNVSGVPALVGGVNSAAIFFTATASNAISRFYNSTRIFRVSGGSGITAVDFTLPSSPYPVSGAISSGSRSVSVNASTTGTTPSYTITAYNSRGTTATGTATSNFRIDSAVDTANRVKSSTGQYPGSGYTTAWDAAQDLSSAGQEELQMLAGQYQYPTGNYTSYTPAGPNYSSLPAVTFGTIRWVTFSLGSQTSIQNVIATLANTSNLGSSALIPSGTPNSTFYMYVKVEGVTGWVDGNAAYPGAGSPVNDGDAALVVADSTATSRKVTFGTTTRTGNVYVRIGFSSGATYRIGSISATYS
jgi:hypothetical protein